MDTLVIDFEDNLFTDDDDAETQQQSNNNNSAEDRIMIEEDTPLSKDGYKKSQTSSTAAADASMSWCQESSDDEDCDDIIITIDSESYDKRTEMNKLNRVLEYSYYPTLPTPSDDRQSPYYAAAAVYRLRPDDTELNNEIDRLIAVSVNLRTTKVITVFVRNTLILVPTHVPISSRLADCIWQVEKKMHNTYRFNNIDLFNSLLPDTKRQETMAFFAARYKKVQVGPKQPYRPPQSTQLAPPVAQNAASGQYLYDDFTLVIVDGGKVVDVAIHGVRGNINDLVAKYKPRRVYCNAMPGDALDVFLRYPYQPFYQSFQKLMVPVFVDTTKVAMNTSPFCDRYDPFCSFCKALLTVRGFFQDIPNTPRFVQHIRAPKPRRRYRVKPSLRRTTNGGFVTKHRRRNGRGGSSYGVVCNTRNRIPMRPGRRSAFNRSVKKEYARKVASTLSPRCDGGPKKRVSKQRRVIVL